MAPGLTALAPLEVPDTRAAAAALIARRYPQIRHLAAPDIPEGAAFFDVRAAAEFAVSRLPGAVRLGPQTPTASCLRLIAATGAPSIVVYCSIGERSSRLAARLEAPLNAQGIAIANLSGGIFEWHAEGRPLHDAAGRPTIAVHPFNASWGRLVAASS